MYVILVYPFKEALLFKPKTHKTKQLCRSTRAKQIARLRGRIRQRRCLEAWHINSAHAPLNRDDGGLIVFVEYFPYI